MTGRPDISAQEATDAAEYVLGLMPSADRAAFRARLASDPVLTAEVQAWEAYFATMAEVEVDAVTPPDRVRGAVEEALFGDAATKGSTALWDRVGIWRGVAFAAVAVAVIAVGVALAPPMRAPMPEGGGIPDGTILMTHLIPTEGSSLGLAVFREPSGALQLRRVAGSMASDRAQEVWLIVGDAAPVSLGVLDEDPLTTLTPPAELSPLFEVGATLAISDEPPGGSPTGAPTGDVLALGTFVAL